MSLNLEFTESMEQGNNSKLRIRDSFERDRWEEWRECRQSGAALLLQQLWRTHAARRLVKQLRFDLVEQHIDLFNYHVLYALL